jgi:hypothetical protein
MLWESLSPLLEAFGKVQVKVDNIEHEALLNQQLENQGPKDETRR